MAYETTTRKSGLTSGHEEAAEESKKLFEQDIEQATAPIEDESSVRKFRTPGFHRMKVDFSEEERIVVQSQIERAEDWLRRDFPEAFHILQQVYEIVRNQVIIEGEALLDKRGEPVWSKTTTGHIYEDYSRLTMKQRESFLFQITTWLFVWEQMASNVWTEAMFARVAWEEKHAIDYDAPRNKTMGERDALAKKGAIDERYFAVFLAGYSRKAEALVRTMRTMAQRMERGAQV